MALEFRGRGISLRVSLLPAIIMSCKHTVVHFFNLHIQNPLFLFCVKLSTLLFVLIFFSLYLLIITHMISSNPIIGSYTALPCFNKTHHSIRESYKQAKIIIILQFRHKLFGIFVSTYYLSTYTIVIQVLL